MNRELLYTITAANNGSSVYTYLRQQLNMSTRLVRRLKRQNGIFINDSSCIVTAVLQCGDLLKIQLIDRDEGGFIPLCDVSIETVYEDDDIVIINKPPNLPTLPATGSRGSSVAGALISHYAALGQKLIFRSVNRLDSGTSGLMVVAKHAYAHERLQKQLHTDDFERIYTAIVCGCINESGVVNAPVSRCKDSVIKRCVHPDGAASLTEYAPLLHSDANTLLRLRLHSGRTHQIRVHMAYIGHPVLGDFLYGSEDNRISHTALCSTEITLTHPITGERLHFCVSPPEEMLRIINSNA